jgi:hypothetical protein
VGTILLLSEAVSPEWPQLKLEPARGAKLGCLTLFIREGEKSQIAQFAFRAKRVVAMLQK